MNPYRDTILANRERLSTCARHDFVQHTRDLSSNLLYRCQRCAGVVQSTARNWYERGLRHGMASVVSSPRPDAVDVGDVLLVPCEVLNVDRKDWRWPVQVRFPQGANGRHTQWLDAETLARSLRAPPSEQEGQERHGHQK